MGMNHIYRWEDNTRLTGAETKELRTRLNDPTALFYLRSRGPSQGRTKVQRLDVRSGTIAYLDVLANRLVAVPADSITEIVFYTLGRTGRFIATPEQIKDFLMSFNSAPMPAPCAPQPASAPMPVGQFSDQSPFHSNPFTSKTATEQAQEALEKAQAALASAQESDAKRAEAAEAQRAKDARLLELAQDTGEVKALQLLVQDLRDLELGVTQYPVQRLEFGKFFDFSALHSYAEYYGYNLIKTGNGDIATLVKKDI